MTTNTEILKLARSKRSSGVRAPRERLSSVTLVLLLLIFSLLYFAPIIGILITSFKSNASIAANGIWSLSGSKTVDNYLQAWTSGSGRTYILNSFLVTLPATFFSITFGVLVGYVVAKLMPRGSNVISLFFTAALFVPPQVLLIPLFKLFNVTGLYDTLWPMIIVHSGYGISLCSLVMRNFFVDIPDALREAAIIDGAHELRILRSVIIPMSRPALAALATLQFCFIWNDFLYPMIFTRSTGVQTVMVGIVSMQGAYISAFGMQAAMAILASLPTIFIFIVFQKQFIAGLTAGAVKG